MSDAADHVLVTRFNLPSPGAESSIRAREGWLRSRVELFERYCAPSVRDQRDARVRWLIYFDPDSPTWLLSWIDRTSRDLFTPVLRSSVSPDELRADLDSLVVGKQRWLITTNLDNDDGLGRHFAAALQAQRPEADTAALYLTRGLIKSPHGLYLRHDPVNAFCSVRESWDDPVTCWVDWHNRLGRHMPVVRSLGGPQWLQVVHGANVSNRVKGRLVSPRPYRDDFVGLEDLPEPAAWDLRTDRLLRAPARLVRDATRSGTRRAAVAVLGKEGVNRAKAHAARVLT